jgi:hypothetical protein
MKTKVFIALFNFFRFGFGLISKIQKILQNIE